MNEMYDSIARDLSGGEIQTLTPESTTLKDLRMHLEAGTIKTALSLVPQLDGIEYEQNRQKIAEAAGVRTVALDKLRRQAEKGKNSEKIQGRALTLPDITPANEPQDGATLLDDITRQVRRFVVIDETGSTAITLWAVFAHLAHEAPCCPNLVFSSAVKACGKSTALDVISRFVPKPLATSNVSPAALFRTVEMLSPTLLIDEADSMFRNNDDLRTLVNAGFTRTAATVVRIVGDDLEPRLFSVYCPKAIALIGQLPDTIESRSIIVRMRRRLPDESIERLRADKDQGFAPLARRIARWVSDNKHLILAEEPELPESLSDRQADAWRELLRIADIAGGEWPTRARSAALELCSKLDEDADIATRLLSDIEKIFNDDRERTKWPSQTLVDTLNAMEEAPWADFARGKGLTTNRLAKMLTRFDIHTRTLRAGTGTPKGYTIESFAEVFSRYLPQNRNTATFNNNTIHDNDLKCCGNVSVADAKRNIPDETSQQEGAQDELGIF
jgi:putative DNA primase/helicase